MAIRDINRNVRGQIVSYPLTQEGMLYGNVFFVDKDDGTQSKVARYLNIDVANNLDVEIKELSFAQRSINPRQIARTRAFWGSNISNPLTSGQSNYFTTAVFTPIQGTTITGGNIPWPPYSDDPDGQRRPLNYGRPGDVYPPLGSNGQATSGNSTSSGLGAAGNTSGGSIGTTTGQTTWLGIPIGTGAPGGSGILNTSQGGQGYDSD